MTNDDDLTTISTILHGARFATVTTRGAHGELHSRPLAILEDDFTGTLWFFTQDPSPKTDDVANDGVVWGERQPFVRVAIFSDLCRLIHVVAIIVKGRDGGGEFGPLGGLIGQIVRFRHNVSNKNHQHQDDGDHYFTER